MRLAALALLTLLLGSAASAETVLRRGMGAEPGSLDPASGDSINQIRLDADLYEGLTAIGPDGHVVPGQAESWAVSADGLVWSFTLRPRLAWSNGAPLTAADFVYSFRRLVDPANGFRGAFLAASIRSATAITARREPDLTTLGVAAPDSRTVQITLEAPNLALPEILALLPPVYRPTIESDGRDAFKPGRFVGNGAYQLIEWQPHVRLVARRNPNYRAADTVAIDQVEYYPIEDQAAELKRYRAGDLDMTADVPYDQLPLIRSEMPAEYKTSPSFGLAYIGFNTAQPPFKDEPKLRRALSLAIDRNALVEKILGGVGIPADGWVPPGLEHYHSAVTGPADREAEARRDYAEAGYSAEKPLKLELTYNTNENTKRVMIAVAAMWRQTLGVETELRNMDLRAFLDLRQHKLGTQAFRAGFVAPYQDPQPMLELLRSGAPFNDMSYANPEFDALLEKAEAALTPRARLDGFAAAEAAALADTPAAPLYFLEQARLVKPYVTGWQPSPHDTFRSQDLAIAPH